MLRFIPSAVTVVFLLAIASSASAGKWFDLGEARFDTLRSEQDPQVVEIFPPNAFGAFPPASYVWQEINVTPCDLLRWPGQVCGYFVRGFRIEFSDAGCGCGGFLERASTLRLTYDHVALSDRGIPESNLRLAFNYNPPINIYNIPGSRAWGPVEGALPDPVNHWFEIPVSGDILGVREYAIVTNGFVPIEAVTWSRIKTLYGR